MEYSNPESQLWGTVKNGQPSGLFKDIVEGKADMAIGAIQWYYERNRVASFSVFFGPGDGGIAIVSPKSRRKQTIFTMLYPFTVEVWMALFMSTLFIQLAIYTFARTEEHIVGTKLLEWSVYENAAWYTFATLLGEDKCVSIVGAKAWGTR